MTPIATADGCRRRLQRLTIKIEVADHLAGTTRGDNEFVGGDGTLDSLPLTPGTFAIRLLTG